MWSGRRGSHPHGISPGKAVAEARAPQNGGRSWSYLGSGRGRLSLAPPRACRELGVGGRGANSACPTPAAAQGHGALLQGEESAFAAVAGSSVTRLPVQRSVAVSPWSLASVLSVWEQEHLGAHRALPPPPTSHTGTFTGEGLRLGQGHWKS